MFCLMPHHVIDKTQTGSSVAVSEIVAAISHLTKFTRSPFLPQQAGDTSQMGLRYEMYRTYRSANS